ncbi:polysaccharide biosynthesis protein [Methylocystis sp.]|uniref:polysaccharide biosynthesis protein n=1 Tax=Methylocystis sp. TaxID=1911079 RepID=UPI003DA69FFC
MLETLYSRLFRLDRHYKHLIQIVVDGALLTVSFAVAMALRLDSFDFASDLGSWLAFLVVLPVTLVAFAKLGFHRAVIRYISSNALRLLLASLLLSAALLFVINQAFGLFVPRSVPFIYLLLAFLTVGGVRFVLRSIHRRRQYRLKKRVVIYGAGASGSQLLVALRQGTEYAPVAFVDDAPTIQGRVIGGYEVYPTSALQELIENEQVEVVLLAIPSATRAQRKSIIDRLEKLNTRIQTIPGIADLVSGRATVGQVRDVAIEDLLGRDPVAPEHRLMDANIRGKAVLVSGAGGSIGSELCRQILRQRPSALVLFEISEFALYTIHQELLDILRRERIDVELAPLLGSVQDQSRVEAALRRYNVATIYHAAAYKHVPMVEHNVAEGVRNNVFGTLALARAAIGAGVGAFILVSTDKAVRPTNVMGATKRMAELVCQAFAREQSGTLFSMVRFGNVLGSSGSVIPLFRRQIEAGGPLTVTHREITRYFMLIPEAAQLVIQAGAMARGGDVFVLDMGEPVRIVDLAERMARLSGLKSVVVDPARPETKSDDSDIEITFSQLRPGEKLYEELLIGENAATTSHPRILTATEVALDWSELAPLLDRLLEACAAQSIPEICALLRSAPTGYSPTDGIADLVWKETRARVNKMSNPPQIL